MAEHEKSVVLSAFSEQVQQTPHTVLLSLAVCGGLHSHQITLVEG